MVAPVASSSAVLMRWLPTLLGLLLVLLVVAAYELGGVERSCAQAECPPCARSDRPAQTRPGRSTERPHPSLRQAEADAGELQDRVALLEAQAALMAERNVTGELSYSGHSPSELEAMARHCDVRVDYPKRLDEREIDDLGLDANEAEAWDRALLAFEEQELEAYRALLRELEPDTPELDALPLGLVRRKLIKLVPGPRSEDEKQLQRHVAEERAGMREQPAALDEESIYTRYNRLRYSSGDRFATHMSAQLGGSRALELREAFGGWPGARTRQWGCPP